MRRAACSLAAAHTQNTPQREVQSQVLIPSRWVLYRKAFTFFLQPDSCARLFLRVFLCETAFCDRPCAIVLFFCGGIAWLVRLSQYVRREIRALTEEDRVAFFDAMETLYRVPDSEGNHLYGDDYKVRTTAPSEEAIPSRTT